MQPCPNRRIPWALSSLLSHHAAKRFSTKLIISDEMAEGADTLVGGVVDTTNIRPWPTLAARWSLRSRNRGKVKSGDLTGTQPPILHPERPRSISYDFASLEGPLGENYGCLFAEKYHEPSTTICGPRMTPPSLQFQRHHDAIRGTQDPTVRILFFTPGINVISTTFEICPSGV